MSKLEDCLKVSLTKNGFNKIGDVLFAVGSTEFLKNLNGQVDGAHINEAQAKSMLNYDDASAAFPAYWEEIRSLGELEIQKCVLVSVIFSHYLFVTELAKASVGEMRGVIRRDDLGEKAYTNLVAFMTTLGLSQYTPGDDERDYNMAPLFSDPALGKYYKRILECKLERCGWPGVDDEFTRDFYQQCKEYGFHDVLAITSKQFEDWLEGQVVDVEEPPAVEFSDDDTVVTASLLLSLTTKPFVILAGAAGTGKTRSARQLAMELRPTGWAEEFSTAFIPVASGWTDARHLLGYRTPFGVRGEEYVATQLLRLLLRANHEDYLDVPFFVILDEMNLSQVEMYFSSFLSLMEVAQAGEKEPILRIPDLQLLMKSRMHDALDSTFAEEAIQNGGLYFTPNVHVIGTVNVDDTTHTFSPKVLDRAFVLEYEPPTPSETKESYSVPKDDSANASIKQLVSFLLKPDLINDAKVREDTTKALDDVFAKMGRYRFGPRTTNEISRFVEIVNAASKAKITPDVSHKDVVDRAILTKILPRLQGSKAMLYQPLKDLLELSNKEAYNCCKSKLEAMEKELSGGYANFFSM